MSDPIPPWLAQIDEAYAAIAPAIAALKANPLTHPLGEVRGAVQALDAALFQGFRIQAFHAIQQLHPSLPHPNITLEDLGL